MGTHRDQEASRGKSTLLAFGKGVGEGVYITYIPPGQVGARVSISPTCVRESSLCALLIAAPVLRSLPHRTDGL